MRKRYTFTELGSPSKPGIYASKDGSRVNLNTTTFNKWKALEFRDAITAMLLHDPEDIGTAIYTVVTV
jgi:hypothetical protein